jgi:hypothetical protein
VGARGTGGHTRPLSQQRSAKGLSPLLLDEKKSKYPGKGTTNPRAFAKPQTHDPPTSHQPTPFPSSPWPLALIFFCTLYVFAFGVFLGREQARGKPMPRAFSKNRKTCVPARGLQKKRKRKQARKKKSGEKRPTDFSFYFIF